MKGLEKDFEPAASPDAEDLGPLREISKCMAALADHYREALLLTDLQGMIKNSAGYFKT
jgi:DDE family transposase